LGEQNEGDENERKKWKFDGHFWVATLNGGGWRE
jgi:hypothetical protein